MVKVLVDQKEKFLWSSAYTGEVVVSLIIKICASGRQSVLLALWRGRPARGKIHCRGQQMVALLLCNAWAWRIRITCGGIFGGVA